MKNGFFSTYQKENCCSDHFGFKTPDDILFCPLQLRIIITRNHNLIMVSKSVGHQFWFKQNWRRVGFYRNNFLNHATTTVIITAQILKILRLLKLKNCISNVWSAQDWLTWLTRLLYWKFNLRFLGHCTHWENPGKLLQFWIHGIFEQNVLIFFWRQNSNSIFLNCYSVCCN